MMKTNKVGLGLLIVVGSLLLSLWGIGYLLNYLHAFNVEDPLTTFGLYSFSGMFYGFEVFIYLLWDVVKAISPDLLFCIAILGVVIFFVGCLCPGLAQNIDEKIRNRKKRNVNFLMRMGFWVMFAGLAWLFLFATVFWLLGPGLIMGQVRGRDDFEGDYKDTTDCIATKSDQFLSLHYMQDGKYVTKNCVKLVFSNGDKSMYMRANKMLIINKANVMTSGWEVPLK